MSGKLKLKGHLKHLARWPLYLSVLLIVLNILVYVINIKAGVVVTMGNVLYLVAAITLLFYHRPLMFNDLIAFASQYEFLEKKVLEELALPYAVMDMQGRMIWSNRMFSQLTGKDPFTERMSVRSFRILQRTNFRDMMEKISQKSVPSLGTAFIVSLCRKFFWESLLHRPNC